MERKIEGVVFDLYDTLIYPGRPVTLHDKVKSITGMSSDDYAVIRRDLMTMHFDDFYDKMAYELPAILPAIDMFKDEIEEDNPHVSLFPETMQVISRLHKEGYKVGLITNLASIHIPPFFFLGLHNVIDYTIFSCAEGYVKPEPQIYQPMIREMGLAPSKIIMTGDSKGADVKGPKAVGMNAVLLDRNNTSDEPERILSLEGIFDHLR